MKTPITTLEDVMSLQLGMLYDAEEKLSDLLPPLISALTDLSLQSLCLHYVKGIPDKRLKIKRMFSYVAREPRDHEDRIIKAFMEEIQYHLETTSPGVVRDVLVAGLLLKVNQFIIDSYRGAVLIALKLEWDVVIDLLDEIIEWETKTHDQLLDFSKEIFNQNLIAN